MVGIPPRTQEDYIKKVTLQDGFGNVNFYLLPYVSTADIKGVLGYNMEQKISYNEAVHKLIEREDIDEKPKKYYCKSSILHSYRGRCQKYRANRIRSKNSGQYRLCKC